jgi:RimJ/RimL family protein N-acetyltransferase
LAFWAFNHGADFVQLETPRLILRPWKDSDLEPFAALNADPDVMEFFPKLMTLEETSAMVERFQARYNADQFCFWAAEEKETGNFIGFIGLGRPSFEAHFMPCVEIGWRLARPYWGKGYAPEGAKEVLRDGFERSNLDEIVAITAALNSKSIRVMEKISMHRDLADDFLHPALEDGHHLKPHVLYRTTQEEWRERL